MSSNLHKMMGYGLNNIQYKSGEFLDSRLNPDGYMFWDQESDKWSWENYIGFLEKRQEQLLNGRTTEEFVREQSDEDFEMLIEIKGDLQAKKNELYSAIHHDGEQGNSEVLLILPFDKIDKWRRYADEIDQADAFESYERTSQKLGHELIGEFNGSKLTLSSNGFGEYRNRYMNKRTGIGFSVSDTNTLNLVGRRCKTAEELRASRFSYNAIMRIVDKMEFSSYEEALENLVPYVPHSVRLLCEFGEVFNDPKTILDLRPMIYSYWS